MKWYQAERYRDKYDGKFDPNTIDHRNLYKVLDSILHNLHALETNGELYRLISKHYERLLKELGLSDKVSETVRTIHDRIKADKEFATMFGISLAIKEAGQLYLELPEFQN